jgi:arginine exporter protein ArgO
MIPAPPPVDVVAIFFTALLNPPVALTAVLMGYRADQWQKIPVAGFAAAMIGTALIYVLSLTGLPGIDRIVRAPAGLFIAQFGLGMVWATAAFIFARRMRR